MSDTLDCCPNCEHTGKIKATITFGYLTLTCKICGWSITSTSRSGDYQYLMDKEMTQRWNGGIDDDTHGE